MGNPGKIIKRIGLVIMEELPVVGGPGTESLQDKRGGEATDASWGKKDQSRQYGATSTIDDQAAQEGQGEIEKKSEP